MNDILINGFEHLNIVLRGVVHEFQFGLKQKKVGLCNSTCLEL